MPDFVLLREQANIASVATQRVVDALGILERGTIPFTDEGITASQRSSIISQGKVELADAIAALNAIDIEING